MILLWSGIALGLAWLAFAYLGYPALLWLLARVAPRPVAAAEIHPALSRDHRGPQRRRRAPAQARADARAALPGPARGDRRLGRLDRRDRPDRGVVRAARGAARAQRAARRQGGRAGARDLRGEGRDPRVHGRHGRDRARLAALDRAAVRGPDGRRGQQRGPRRGGGRRGRLRALRDGAAPARERGGHDRGLLGLVLRGSPRARLALAEPISRATSAARSNRRGAACAPCRSRARARASARWTTRAPSGTARCARCAAGSPCSRPIASCSTRATGAPRSRSGVTRSRASPRRSRCCWCSPPAGSPRTRAPRQRVLFAAQLLLYALGGLALAYEPARRSFVARIAGFFMLVNASMLVAWAHHLAGRRAVTWEPTRR